MNCTIFGATGFIGAKLAVYLRAEGHDVWTPKRGDKSIFTRSLGYVFYCVGLTADYRNKPFETVRAHVGFLTDVLEFADFTSLIYLSSTRVYSRSQLAREEGLLRVNSTDPSDLYNLSKLTGESLCYCSKKSGVKVVRLSNVIGINEDSSNFIFELIREARLGHILLKSAPTSCKDYIWVEDVVKLLTLIALKGQYGLYNVASGKNVTHQDIVSRLSSLTGCSVEVAIGALPQVFPMISIDRIFKEFNFYPKAILENLDEILITDQ